MPESLLGAESSNRGIESLVGFSTQKERFIALNTWGGCHGIVINNTHFLHLSDGSGRDVPGRIPSAFLAKQLNQRVINLKKLVCKAASRPGELNFAPFTETSDRIGISHFIH
jgi:hypothetical protein